MLSLWRVFSPRLLRSVRSASSLALEMEPSPPLSKRLWDDSRREALFALYNPFVVSLAAGTLPRHRFQHYIAQDAFFIDAFAHAYEIAIQNTSDQNLKSKIHDLHTGACDELKMHNSLMEEWNIDMSLSEVPLPATIAYTSFLLAVAAGTDVEVSAAVDRTQLAAYTLGAMTPCMRLYAFVGQELRKTVGYRDDHPYERWISTYSSAEFEKGATQHEDILDGLSKKLVPADVPVVKSLYDRAMKYEVNFFDAHADVAVVVPLVTSALLKDRKVIVVSDFDSTCSVSDSCPVLAELAMLNGPSDIRDRWNSLCESYSRDYNDLLRTVLRDEAGADYSYDEVKASLQAVSEFEKKGNSKVFESGIFEGMKLEDVERAAEKMPLQAGCACVFKRLVQRGVPCHILSVCWSQTFIEAALAKANVNGASIHSNELSNDGGVCDGKLVKRIETPLDKESFMLGTIASQSKPEIVIYIGDSLTDLLCLLQADIGIVVGNSSSLEKAAKSFGVKILPLLSGVFHWERTKLWKKTEGIIYRASSWMEIEAFLLGHEKDGTCILVSGPEQDV